MSAGVESMLLPLFLIVLWGAVGFWAGRTFERGWAVRAMNRAMRSLERCESRLCDCCSIDEEGRWCA